MRLFIIVLDTSACQPCMANPFHHSAHQLELISISEKGAAVDCALGCSCCMFSILVYCMYVAQLLKFISFEQTNIPEK